MINSSGCKPSHGEQQKMSRRSCGGAWGAVGVRCLAQGHLSPGIEGEESAVHSLPSPTIPAGSETRTRNL